jgi:2-polyprenyl-3-methyl-5-hydroxy-6-metoxy-1,4-benzoquinol methylase
MYSIEYINCRVCGTDNTTFLGIRGNREYAGAGNLANSEKHVVTNIVRCKKCGFVYTNPLIKLKTDPYGGMSDYASSSSVGPERLFNFSLNLIERYARKGKILDIGCGKGEFLSAAKTRGWEVHGLEPSLALSEFASTEYGINVVCSSLEETQYPDGFFDAVTLNMVLEHIDDPRKIVSEMRRILKKGGILFVEVPNMESMMLKAAALYFRLQGKNWSPLLSPLHYPYHCYGYNISSLRYLLRAQRFQIERVLIRDSSLRGFRPDTNGMLLEKVARDMITKVAGLIGKGDVLMLIARKKSNGI